MHRTTELEFEQTLWSQQDWTWLAVFARHEVAKRLPEPGDVWLQVATMETQKFEDAPKVLSEMDPDLAGPRDIIMLLHVEELPKDLLSHPRDIFCEPADDNMNVPVPVGDSSGGVGELSENACSSLAKAEHAGLNTFFDTTSRRLTSRLGVKQSNDNGL